MVYLLWEMLEIFSPLSLSICYFFGITHTSFIVLLVLLACCFILSFKISTLSVERGLKWNCDRRRLGKAHGRWHVNLWQASTFELFCFLFKLEKE